MRGKETDNRLVAYFGFGSLVNLDTLRTDYIAAYPASLKGWKRHFQKRGSISEPTKNVAGSSDFAWQVDPALLSVHRHATCAIDGMIIVDQLENLPLVDQREKLYERVQLSPDQFELAYHDAISHNLRDFEVYIYVGLLPDDPPANSTKPVLLQSYMDAVMMGYYTHFGAEGVERFIATTDGLELTMVEDRKRPLYPRSIKLETELQIWFTQLLQTAGVATEAV